MADGEHRNHRTDAQPIAVKLHKGQNNAGRPTEHRTDIGNNVRTPAMMPTVAPYLRPVIARPAL